MAKYVFRCLNCGKGYEVVRSMGDQHSPVCVCGSTTVRDYGAEFSTVGVHIPGYMSSKNTTSKSDFLPSEKDFERPGDSDGSKGMKEWKNSHELKGHREV